MADAASDFQKIISAARERRKNEALADKIFSRNRRRSAPSRLKPAPGGSLASRVGVRKQGGPSANGRRANLPSANVSGEWTHDLYDASIQPAPLRERVALPGFKPAAKRSLTAQRHYALASASSRMDVDQVNVVGASRAGGGGITIRGLAGPFAVMGQNFAPGTTAADIESVMTPVGGEMVSCEIVKTKPFLMAEMVFASREGGERVISAFDDKTADGRVLKVYPKMGGYRPATRNASPPINAPNGPRAARSSLHDQVVDGSMGFSGGGMMEAAGGSTGCHDAVGGHLLPLFASQLQSRVVSDGRACTIVGIGHNGAATDKVSIFTGD